MRSSASPQASAVRPLPSGSAGGAAFLVLAWVRRIKAEGIRSIVVLMGDKKLRHYDLADVGGAKAFVTKGIGNRGEPNELTRA